MKLTVAVFFAGLVSAYANPAGMDERPSGALFPAANASPPVLLAQADGATRISQLEEQIRALNGRIEELGFQMLQIQEDMRRRQEDNEFRFKQLEEGGAPRQSGDASGATAAPVSPPVEQAQTGTETGTEPPAASPSVGTDPGGMTSGVPPRTLGSVTFDADGNVTGETVQPVNPVNPAAPVAADNPAPASASESFDVAYGHILAGEYGLAETAFRGHVSAYPQGERNAEARFWLGESLLGQGKNKEAASVFLDAHKDHPDSDKAPDMLFKLAVALAALQDRDMACATLREVIKKHPDSPEDFQQKVKAENATLNC